MAWTGGACERIKFDLEERSITSDMRPIMSVVNHFEFDSSELCGRQNFSFPPIKGEKTRRCVHYLKIEVRAKISAAYYVDKEILIAFAPKSTLEAHRKKLDELHGEIAQGYGDRIVGSPNSIGAKTMFLY